MSNNICKVIAENSSTEQDYIIIDDIGKSTSYLYVDFIADNNSSSVSDGMNLYLAVSTTTSAVRYYKVVVTEDSVLYSNSLSDLGVISYGGGIVNSAGLCVLGSDISSSNETTYYQPFICGIVTSYSDYSYVIPPLVSVKIYVATTLNVRTRLIMPSYSTGDMTCVYSGVGNNYSSGGNYNIMSHVQQALWGEAYTDYLSTQSIYYLKAEIYGDSEGFYGIKIYSPYNSSLGTGRDSVMLSNDYSTTTIATNYTTNTLYDVIIAALDEYAKGEAFEISLDGTSYSGCSVEFTYTSVIQTVPDFIDTSNVDSDYTDYYGCFQQYLLRATYTGDDETDESYVDLMNVYSAGSQQTTLLFPSPSNAVFYFNPTATVETT